MVEAIDYGGSPNINVEVVHQDETKNPTYQLFLGGKVKIIFLNIDGVLNYVSSKQVEIVNGYPLFDDEPKALINQLIEVTGAKLVVYSNWRLDDRIEGLEITWTDNKMAGSIIGVIPQLVRIGNYSLPQGCKIDYWLHNASFEAEPLESYCIIDDDSDMLISQFNNFVWVKNGFCRKGFEPKHFVQAFRILQGF